MHSQSSTVPSEVHPPPSVGYVHEWETREPYSKAACIGSLFDGRRASPELLPMIVTARTSYTLHDSAFEFHQRSTLLSESTESKIG